MIRIESRGTFLPSSAAALEDAARAVEASRLADEQEARAERVFHEAVNIGFDHESLSARIMEDLKAGYEARMDAYMRDVLGDLGNWHPTGLFQSGSIETEAGHRA